MKTKTLLLVILSVFYLNINAQRIVALHSPVNGVQFFDDDNPLQSAYAAAVDNDTIYLPGGSFIPPTKFEKKLTIFGVGHHPVASASTFPTTISGNFDISDEADGFYLEGVVIAGNLRFDTNESVNNVTIKRCKMTSLQINGDRTNPAENNVFIENIINGIDSRNLLNSSFFNNIIQERVNEARSLNFINNDFLYSRYSSYSHYYLIGYANACMFKNNVFRRHENINDICGGAGASNWIYNIFVSANPTLGTNSTSANNYQISPWTDIFVNVADTNSFDYNSDYHLQNPANYQGDDGTVVGIYGGFYPWKTQSIPVTPHISSQNISNTSDSNGMIHIDINVHAQDR